MCNFTDLILEPTITKIMINGDNNSDNIFVTKFNIFNTVHKQYTNYKSFKCPVTLSISLDTAATKRKTCAMNYIEDFVRKRYHRKSVLFIP